jgi:hypothetical protein
METRVEIIQNRLTDTQHDLEVSNDKLGSCVSRSHKNTQEKLEDYSDKIKELDERHSGEIDELR